MWLLNFMILFEEYGNECVSLLFSIILNLFHMSFIWRLCVANYSNLQHFSVTHEFKCVRNHNFCCSSHMISTESKVIEYISIFCFSFVFSLFRSYDSWCSLFRWSEIFEFNSMLSKWKIYKSNKCFAPWKFINCVK